MDQFLPSYQLSKRHQITVRCGPGELLDIIQDFQPPKDRSTRRPDRYSLIMFFPYWLLIWPVSGLLRRRFLGTIRRIAESEA